VRPSLLNGGSNSASTKPIEKNVEGTPRSRKWRIGHPKKEPLEIETGPGGGLIGGSCGVGLVRPSIWFAGLVGAEGREAARRGARRRNENQKGIETEHVPKACLSRQEAPHRVRTLGCPAP
jgi:hypothetical protein